MSCTGTGSGTGTGTKTGTVRRTVAKTKSGSVIRTMIGSGTTYGLG